MFWIGVLLTGYTSELLLQLRFYFLSKVKLEKTVKAVLVERWAAAFSVPRSSGSFFLFWCRSYLQFGEWAYTEQSSRNPLIYKGFWKHLYWILTVSKMAGGVSCQAFGLLISVWPTKDTRQVFLDSFWVLSNFSHWFTTKQTRSLSTQRALRRSWYGQTESCRSSKALHSNSRSFDYGPPAAGLCASDQGHTATETLWYFREVGVETEAASSLELFFFFSTFSYASDAARKI